MSKYRSNPAVFGHDDHIAMMSESGECRVWVRLTLPPVRQWVRRHMEGAMIKTNVRTQKRHVCKTIDSPVGKLKLVATGEGLAAILWENDSPCRVRLNIEAED